MKVLGCQWLRPYVGYVIAVVHSGLFTSYASDEGIALRHTVFVVVQDRYNYCAFTLIHQNPKLGA